MFVHKSNDFVFTNSFGSINNSVGKFGFGHNFRFLRFFVRINRRCYHKFRNIHIGLFVFNNISKFKSTAISFANNLSFTFCFFTFQIYCFQGSSTVSISQNRFKFNHGSFHKIFFRNSSCNFHINFTTMCFKYLWFNFILNFRILFYHSFYSAARNNNCTHNCNGNNFQI